MTAPVLAQCVLQEGICVLNSETTLGHWVTVYKQLC